LPRLAKEYYVNFYGGEPVLNFDIIERTVNFLIIENTKFKKRSHFSITTNGALLSEEEIRFLDKHCFSVELSFDGLAQVIRRDRKSYDKVIQAIANLLESQNIRLEINSVFDAESVEYVSESIAFIIGLGVRNINLSLSILGSWNQPSLDKLEQEIAKLGNIQLDYYKNTGEIRLVNFREDDQKGIFYCSAGRDRLAVSTDGKIWGCHLFADYFKDRENSPQYEEYCFGNLGNLGRRPENVFSKIHSNYSQLSMDNFSTKATKCFLCPDLESCTICPMNVSFAGHSLGEIPDYVCAIQKIKIREKEKFSEGLSKIHR
jgi:radical SAM protein with 4Fe4S-binding SPASM domain